MSSHTSTVAANFGTRVNTFYAATERYLDIAGYVPGINVVSSAARALLATGQAIHALALFVFAAYKHISHIISTPSTPTSAGQSQPQKSPANVFAYDAMNLLKNSALNFVRSSFESTGLGGIICLIFDCFKSDATPKFLGNVYGRNVINIEIHRPLIAQMFL
jgi:hypothetical protein